MSGEIARWRREASRKRLLWLGLATLALCGIGSLINPQQFFHSYLAAYVFWLGIPLGSLALLMLHHLVGGRWGFVIQRLLEAAIQTFPVMALLFLPVLFGMSDLYPWARPEVVASQPALQSKTPYLNLPFFLARAALYFAVWISLGRFLRKWSVQQDRTADGRLTLRLQRLSGPGLMLYALTVTFSTIDWIMSLEPLWTSTIFGMIFMVSYGLSALAFVIIVSGLLADEGPLGRVMSPGRFHDLGNLLLALVMFWAYLNFSQFLLIWAENLPEEIPWYLHRLRGGWEWIALSLIVFLFALPFVLLLSRATKRRAWALSRVSAAILLMHWINLAWMVVPSFHPGQFHVHWLDIAAPIGVGGVWLALFIHYLNPNAHSLLPLHDPRFTELLEPAREA
ncbi:MAG: hypothetical protein HY695_32625 [Deltaproteobacteria bacterium]|nr:hypothetical protein [Deltaproteobacteria bacterium]